MRVAEAISAAMMLRRSWTAKPSSSNPSESLSGGFAPEHVPSGKSADDFEAEFAKLTW